MILKRELLDLKVKTRTKYTDKTILSVVRCIRNHPSDSTPYCLLQRRTPHYEVPLVTSLPH